MVYKDWLYHDSSQNFIKDIHEIDLIKQPFSDKDIIEIQDKFLSNGFHYLKSNNVNQGRKIVYTFLASIAKYHDIACLTLDSQPLHKEITDLYTELFLSGATNRYHVEEYFIEHFYFDFIWIEATQKLLVSPWFELIKAKMLEISINKQIPILVFVYSEQ